MVKPGKGPAFHRLQTLKQQGREGLNYLRSHNGGNGRRLTSQASLNAYVRSICDIMRRSNCADALQYVPELTRLLFLMKGCLPPRRDLQNQGRGTS